jgi:hypothetical protein
MLYYSNSEIEEVARRVDTLVNIQWDDIEWKRLRKCNAKVGYVYDESMKRGYYVLVSYSTIVAVIDTATDSLLDFLRWSYGYTATSAQHIAKFSHDYGAGKWGCEHRFTWREG